MRLNVTLLWHGLSEDGRLVEFYSPEDGHAPSHERPIYSVALGPANSNNAATELPVVPLKYRGHQQRIGLKVVCAPPLGANASVSLSFTRDPSRLSKPAWEHILLVDRAGTTPVPGGFVVSLNVDELLQKLGARVNEDVIWARVMVMQDGQQGSAVTRSPLHVLLRKAVVLLPGVLGSTLWVEPTSPRLAWPPLALTHSGQVEAFRSLASDERGVPYKAPSQMSFVGARISGVSDVKPGPYKTAAWEKVLNQSTLRLGLRVSGSAPVTPLPHYFIQGWPYDWRLAAPRLIEMLLEGPLQEHGAPLRLDDVYSSNPLFRAGDFEGYLDVARPPSLATLLAHYARVDPFISDKVALAGHSTGGVVMNGAVRDPRAARYVDQAFFIATPFRGAPKALKALLRGTMDLSFIEEWIAIDAPSFRQLGGNLAVLYFLAPGFDYEAPVIEIATSAQPQTFFARDLTPGMTALLETARRYVLPSIVNDKVVWRPGLAQAARDYVASIQRTPVSIGDASCVVFYSQSRKKTVAGARFEGRGGFVTKDPESLLTFPTLDEGDGTVPRASLLGMQNAQARRTVLIQGDVDHTEIIASEQLWTTVARSLASTLGPAPAQPVHHELDLDLGAGTAAASGRWYRQGHTLVIELGA
jgi:hypothetical protein